MHSLDDRSGRDLAQEWDEKDVSYLYLLVAEREGEYSRISSTDVDFRTSQISIRQFVETRQNSGWKIKHHYNITDFSASVQHKETFQVLASYPHRSVHQPWGRIQGNRRSEAFRPLRCTVADTDDFLQIKRKLVRVNERYSTYQVKQMKSLGPEGGVENMNTIYCIAELVYFFSLIPDLVILCSFFFLNSWSTVCLDQHLPHPVPPPTWCHGNQTEKQNVTMCIQCGNLENLLLQNKHNLWYHLPACVWHLEHNYISGKWRVWNGRPHWKAYFQSLIKTQGRNNALAAGC